MSLCSKFHQNFIEYGGLSFGKKLSKQSDMLIYHVEDLLQTWFILNTLKKKMTLLLCLFEKGFSMALLSTMKAPKQSIECKTNSLLWCKNSLSIDKAKWKHAWYCLCECSVVTSLDYINPAPAKTELGEKSK